MRFLVLFLFITTNAVALPTMPTIDPGPGLTKGPGIIPKGPLGGGGCPAPGGDLNPFTPGSGGYMPPKSPVADPPKDPLPTSGGSFTPKNPVVDPSENPDTAGTASPRSGSGTGSNVEEKHKECKTEDRCHEQDGPKVCTKTPQQCPLDGSSCTTSTEVCDYSKIEVCTPVTNCTESDD